METKQSETRSADNPMGPWKVAKDFHVPEGFSDTSWKNDLNPSVTCDATGATIYWDTETGENIAAEFPDGMEVDRFIVCEAVASKTIYSGNDLAEAIRIARSTEIPAHLQETVAVQPEGLTEDDHHAAAKALDDLKTAFRNLASLWAQSGSNFDEAFSDGDDYPFDLSFDEVAARVSGWNLKPFTKKGA